MCMTPPSPCYPSPELLIFLFLIRFVYILYVEQWMIIKTMYKVSTNLILFQPPTPCTTCITSPFVLSHLVLSRLVSSHLVASRLVSSRFVSSRLVSFRLVSSRLVSSRLVSSRLVSSCLVSFRLVSFHVMF